MTASMSGETQPVVYSLYATPAEREVCRRDMEAMDRWRATRREAYWRDQAAKVGGYLNPLAHYRLLRGQPGIDRLAQKRPRQ